MPPLGASPQLSGRGLGHTGGTLDKLEAIPGWRADVHEAAYLRQLEDVGAVICAAGEDLAPADKLLYALRDVTGTVESIPLIASPIMSKKIAEGADALVLDVKTGSGAFMKDADDARTLARTMVGLGSHRNGPDGAKSPGVARGDFRVIFGHRQALRPNDHLHGDGQQQEGRRSAHPVRAAADVNRWPRSTQDTTST